MKDLRAKNSIADDMPVFLSARRYGFFKAYGRSEKMLMVFGNVLKKTAETGNR